MKRVVFFRKVLFSRSISIIFYLCCKNFIGKIHNNIKEIRWRSRTPEATLQSPC